MFHFLIRSDHDHYFQFDHVLFFCMFWWSCLTNLLKFDATARFFTGSDALPCHDAECGADRMSCFQPICSLNDMWHLNFWWYKNLTASLKDYLTFDNDNLPWPFRSPIRVQSAKVSISIRRYKQNIFAESLLQILDIIMFRPSKLHTICIIYSHNFGSSRALSIHDWLTNWQTRRRCWPNKSNGAK